MFFRWTLPVSPPRDLQYAFPSVILLRAKLVQGFAVTERVSLMSNATASPPQLLVVEDDPEILTLVRHILQDGGYGVTSTTSLAGCQSLVEQRLFHFILTDLFYHSGQRSPLQSIQPLIEQATPIPIGVMTAWPVPEDDPAIAHLAFLLHKPFELEDLLGKVDAELHPTIRSARQNALVEEFFQALNARDWPRLTRLCMPDLRVAPRAAGLSHSVGLPGYLQHLERRWSLLPDYTVEEARIFPRQEGAAARYLARWQGSDGIEHRAAGSMRRLTSPLVENPLLLLRRHQPTAGVRPSGGGYSCRGARPCCAASARLWTMYW